MFKKTLVMVILVVFVIAVILGLYKILNPKNKEILAQGNYIEATFLAEAILPETAEMVHIGDTIYDSQGKKCFTVTDVKVVPSEAKYVYYDQNRLYVENTSKLKDVYIVAKSVDKKFAWAYSYGKDLIMAGAHLALYGNNWKFWVTVVTVKEVK
ncbi:MAG: DUF4330 domain-containing protein [Caldisericaceae bacterium]